MKRFIVAALGLLASMGGVRAEELVYWSVWAEPEPQAVALKQIFSITKRRIPVSLSNQSGAAGRAWC